MKHRGFTLAELLIVVAIVGVLALALWSIIPTSRRGNASRASCQSNLKQMGLGFLQYEDDYDGKFPRVSLGGCDYGWADALEPYLLSNVIYQCPSDNNAGSYGNPRVMGYTDYWYNRNLAGVLGSKMSSRGTTILMGDGNDGNAVTDARYALSSLPTTWLNDENSPAYRHLGGMNFAFADGHVKWYIADKLTPNGPPNATFRPPASRPTKKSEGAMP